MSNHPNTENFREHLANVTDSGKRIWIYPKIIKGAFYRYRTYLSWFLLAFFFLAPFIKIGGYPLLLLNVFERKFVIFGQPFWPQDFHVFVFLALTLLVFIVLFTVVFGRVWCGWACPQTIFMEMVFRKIENWIEGNANKQKKLDAMPWNREKILKKGAKHFVFLLISFIIAHTFFVYLIGYEELWAMISGPLSENYIALVGLVIFTIVFYLVFAKLREIVCIIICPYGRLQGVMLDPNSMVVAYDEVRGEPRGKRKRGEDQSDKGDCVDCGLCVDVCPTGIDIRNGTQLECVNCTACMDACDSVMEKINLPKGLVRIDSKNNIQNRVGFKFTPRIIAYSIVMLILFGSSVGILATRTSVEANMFRVPGMTYTEAADGKVSNLYNLSLVNKTFEDMDFQIELKTKNATLIRADKDTILESNNEEKKVILIEMEQKHIHDNEVPMEMDLYIEGKLVKTFNTKFLAPVRE
ncbi:MAG: cytochrome c oxidase accessory protein CcoG [Bacteroidia bacterium]|nr:cytochrome c oxidase accessory protein CcoG [Bacteroidia bacterium]